MRISAPHLLATALLLAATDGFVPATAWAAPQAASTSAGKASSAAKFSTEQLDQIMASVALYPDSLLAQVLMASTYPGDVADAAKWSEKNKDAKGEAAVKQVASQPWDPSVQSLVAFPQLLAVLGQDPAWVQKMGDAFLAQPEDVMASVQRLRAKADAAGNLKTNEQQVVTKQPAPASTTTVVQQPAQQTIVIEPADPEVVYVPSYNPSVVYGGWAYPSYPPYYYPPPPYYYPGGALLSFGIGMAVGGALWGDLDWGHGDIDIDVNRYNEFNSNRQIDRSSNKWNHNAANRDGVPYRDNASRERYGNQREGASQRDSFRGHDQARNADRQRAAQSLENRGIQGPATSNAEARQRAGQASRDIAQQPRAQQQRAQAGTNGQRGNAGASAQQRPATSNSRAQQDARQRAANTQAGTRTGNNSAFQGASNPSQSRAASSRGHSSQAASQRSSSGARSAGRPVQRSAPSRSGGGGGRRR